MSASDDNDNFEMSMAEPPTSRPDIAPNPFLAAIGSTLPSLTSRVTRSQRSAIQPLGTEIPRISPKVESDVLPTSNNPLAPLSKNLGAKEEYFSEIISNLPSDSEVQFTFNNLQRIINIFANTGLPMEYRWYSNHLPLQWELLFSLRTTRCNLSKYFRYLGQNTQMLLLPSQSISHLHHAFPTLIRETEIICKHSWSHEMNCLL